MKRTRKWAFVEQEATRLAGLGLAPVDIAKRLGVGRNTVQRWMAAGKLADTRHGKVGQRRVTTVRSAKAWGKAVRSEYALDATDIELVKMGEAALAAAHDPTESTASRLSAMGRFQAIVKQLALVARSADADEPEEEEPKPPIERPKRTGTDPRTVLMAVK